MLLTYHLTGSRHQMCHPIYDSASMGSNRNNIIHIIFILLVLEWQRYGYFSDSPNKATKIKPVISTGEQSNYYEKTTNLFMMNL